MQHLPLPPHDDYKGKFYIFRCDRGNITLAHSARTFSTYGEARKAAESLTGENHSTKLEGYQVLQAISVAKRISSPVATYPVSTDDPR